MEVDTLEVSTASRNSSAGAVACPKTQGASTLQARDQPTGPHQRTGPKAKQGVHAMVTNVMEHHGISQEDWEQSQKPDYRVDPLNPPTWVVRRPPGQHLATLEGAPIAKWRAEPNITADELLLTTLAEGTSQACSYRSQESYFRTIQLVKEAIQRYEDAQGLQYRENPVHLDSEIAGLIPVIVTHLQWELREAKDRWQDVSDREVDARVHLGKAEKRVAQLKQDLAGAQDAAFVGRSGPRGIRGHEWCFQHHG